MNRTPPCWTLLSGVLCAMLLAACQGGASKALVPLTPLAGEWRATSALISSTCPAEFPAGPPLAPGPYLIEQSGTSLILSSEGCCGNVIWGVGSVDDDTLTFHREGLIDQGPGCSLGLLSTVSGPLDDERITGEATLVVSPSGDCGAGFPCEIRGTFSLDRCATDCAAILCAQIVCGPE